METNVLDSLNDVLTERSDELPLELKHLFLVHRDDTDPQCQIDLPSEVSLQTTIQLDRNTSFCRVVCRSPLFLLDTVDIEESVRSVDVALMPDCCCIGSHSRPVFELAVIKDFRG